MDQARMAMRGKTDAWGLVAWGVFAGEQGRGMAFTGFAGLVCVVTCDRQHTAYLFGSGGAECMMCAERVL